MSVSKSFRLSEECIQALEDQVAAGFASNQTALVEGRIRRERLRLQIQRDEEDMDREWREARADADDREELALVQKEFTTADSEAWSRL